MTDTLFHTRTNLTFKERKAIISLKNNTDIVIKNADKGGAIVIWGRRQYLNEADRQLSNKMYYEPIKKDPTLMICKEINDYITKLEKEAIIDFNLAAGLKTQNPRTPIFYLLPKIHKANNPGRPIVSQTNGPTSKISKFVDYFLKRHAIKTKSYIKDTTHFLMKLSSIKEIPEKSILVTIYVTSLYTNIPHDDGIKAARRSLETREDKTIPTEVIIKLIKFILTKNAFQFNGKFYRQKLGTTMGSIMSVNYSNLTMDDLETSFLKTQTLLPLIWLRFIDDIFSIWTWGADALHDFLEDLNDFHPTLKFTAEFSDTAVHFLDTTVIKVGTKLHTKLYTKPTDSHQYLDYRSCHPRNQKDNIPFSQALRIRKICSRIEDYEFYSERLKKYFLAKHYPSSLLDNAIEKARKTDRMELLQSQCKNKSNSCIPLSLTYHPNLNRIPKILQTNYKNFIENPVTNHFSQHRVLTAFKKATNLRQILVKSDATIRKVQEHGTFPCAQKCIICKYMVKTNIASNRDGSYSLKIKGHLDGTSVSVVYLITCKKCGIQYIGQTGNSLRQRMYAHLNDISRNDTYKPVSAHFTQHTIENLVVMALRTSSNGTNDRLRLEDALINNFKSRSPNGLNLKS